MTTGSVDDSEVPPWLRTLARRGAEVGVSALTEFFAPPGSSPREAAVLMIFADGKDGAGADGADSGVVGAGRSLVLLERSSHLRSHAGQIAFPGGRQDAEDQDSVATALREAQEEIGLDPAGVHVFGVLPSLWLPPTNYAVTPVLAWWHTTSEIHAVDPAETASVHTVPLDDLLDPANRVTVRHPSGHFGPAFLVDDLVVWGFTAHLMSRVFALAGWEQPWDDSVVVPLPERLVESSERDLSRLGGTA